MKVEELEGKGESEKKSVTSDPRVRFLYFFPTFYTTVHHTTVYNNIIRERMAINEIGEDGKKGS